jgi:hypothetical protein
MSYTYEPYMPEVYDGKMFMVTPDEGDPFMVSVANDESEIPALVEAHLNPPPPRPYMGSSQYDWGPKFNEVIGSY